jgi:hypothetical protein
MNTLPNIPGENTSPQNLLFWGNGVSHDYQSYDNLSSKQLDSDFNHVLKVLVQAMNKLNDAEKKASMNVLATVIEHYIALKIDKDFQQSLKKVLKLFNE